MGAFGSCLGVGRPVRPGANPRLLGSNLVNVDTNPFGLPNGPNGTTKGGGPIAAGGTRGHHQFSRNPSNISNQHGTNQIVSTTRQAYLTNNNNKISLPNAIPKLLRQSSSLAQNGGGGVGVGINSPQQQQQQQQQPPFSPSQNVPKLVDIDDNSFDKNNNNNNSHLICNNKNNSGNINNNNNGGKLPASVLFMQSIQMNPNEARDLLALYSYEPRTNDDLGFVKGEHLETTLSLMNDQWWLARSKSTKKIGWVPSNYVAELKTLGAEPWYLGKIGRTEAENRLRRPENKDGAFIIRISDNQKDNQYSLSLKHENDIKHYRIRKFETGGFYINKKQVFSTIHSLVEHYSQGPDGLCINLREPCFDNGLDNNKPTTAGLSYDTCDIWEANRNLITIGAELGRGQFGQVFEGLYHTDKGKQVRVAIKTLRKGSMDPQDFLAEAQIMKKMRHENLVQLFAVCTREEPVYIITELMSKGALIDYLKTETGKNLPLNDYIKMATQIANGMSYIERENFVHRDLAARNILVGEHNICKIADFGLARFIKEDEYEAKAGARFPIKWTAPEAANYSKFTIKSDVWSFGIVLYEIITKGGTPYHDMSNAEVLSRIDKGYRMPQPPNCEPKYYSIMLECWNKDPSKRPTFDCLHWRLGDYFSSEEQYRDAMQFRDR